jgi:hypothetical protein
MMRCVGRWPPYTVVAYVTIVATILATLLVRDATDRGLLFGGPLLLLGAIALVRGVWIAWLLLVGLHAGDLVVALTRWPEWSTILVNGPLLALLLGRPTRRHAQRGHPQFRKWFRLRRGGD